MTDCIAYGICMVYPYKCGMSIWKYRDPLLLKNEKITIEDPLILDELDRMRDAIIWKRFRSADNPISQSSKSAHVFDKILLNLILDTIPYDIIRKRLRSAQSSKTANEFEKHLSNPIRNTSVQLTSWRHGPFYYLDYDTNSNSMKKTYYLENVDANDKKINPNYILLKLLAPAATGLFATLVGLGYISSRAYNKRKPFIVL